MCEVNPSPPDDPEDGIPDETQRSLKALDPSSTTWETLYRLVFPSDPSVPNPDPHPLIELPELEAALDAQHPTLKSSLREKLALFLPPSLLDADTDANYLSFLTGQLALVVETHQVDVIRQCQARHAPAMVGGGRLNRRSRRETLLFQSFHRHGGEQGKAVHRHSRRGSKKASLLLGDEQLGGGRVSLEGEGNTTRWGGRVSHARPAAGEDGDGGDDDGLRDPRDSGIGMACEACGREGCYCDGVGETVRQRPDTGEGSYRGDCEDDEEDGQEQPLLASPRSRDGYAPPPSMGRALPRLSLRTSGLAVAWHGVGNVEVGSVVSGASGGSGVGGRFSPESFKQRVLRAGLGV
ncbi:hypothetical protein C8A05DRAFT_12573 [Staphylotrichum tortipilum]|uniref:Uncharacterized protein n=1 Tax=Staphylotrichum tortipilum TaxID=2831512 RepID=A0AAN6MTC7_9PEZI|nr:hypothetical protein C8A05DRAFT_12573 [Staphylotrichum longicolle]